MLEQVSRKRKLDFPIHRSIRFPQLKVGEFVVHSPKALKTAAPVEANEFRHFIQSTAGELVIALENCTNKLKQK
jgi:hypothetical protein